MTGFIIAFLSLALLLGIYTFALSKRVLMSVAFAVILAGLFFGYSDMLGRPKALTLELLGAEGDVLSVHFDEGNGIYVWVLPTNSREPRYFVLPWNLPLAEKINNAMEQSGGRGVTMRFERSWDGRDPMFYPKPQEAFPPKLLPKVN